MKRLACILFPLIGLASRSLAQTGPLEHAQRVVATLRLAAQEYALAFEGGRLVRPEEVGEATLFVAEALSSTRELPAELASQVRLLIEEARRLVMAGSAAESVSWRAVEVERRLAAALGVALDERPPREPSVASGALLYGSTCARCHGPAGRGDGPVAVRLDPPPTNLVDSAALASSTPLDLFRKITHGVPGTRMPAYGEALSDQQRWDVVAYVLSLADASGPSSRSGSALVAFGTVRGELGGALELARHGERQAAGRKVLDAYLAFEAVEGVLRPAEPALVGRVERRFASLREGALLGLSPEELERRRADLLAVLRQAEEALGRGRSAGGLFVESFLLLLREGFEAILVIGAVMAVLVRAGAESMRRQVRWGVAAALAASLVTAGLLEWLFRVGAAQREALEGAVMLVAAATLFYVSYWLISKVEVAAWQRFVRDKVQSAVARGSSLALGGVAFLAVYREGFETVLFYKALYATGGAGGAAGVSAGMAAGAVALAGLYVGIERFGVRIPMRPFFAVTSAMLYYLAFVFAGQGVKELQQGGIVSTTPVPGGPRAEFFGVYPTVETLAAQGAILLALGLAMAWILGHRAYDAVARRRVGAPRASEEESEAATV